MKLVMAGSRSVTSEQFNLALCELVTANEFQWPDEVVCGMCPKGADKWAVQWANAWKIPVKPYYADWDAHGKSAGPKRNREMAVYGDALIVFWDGKSRGSKNMIEEMERLGKQVKVKRTDV